MSEIPNLNKVYEDETGAVWLHDIGGEGELLVVHVNIIPTLNRTILFHYARVMDEICRELAERGIETIEAWCATDKELRFAQFFGFELQGELMIDNKRTIPALYRLQRKTNR